MSLSFRQDSLCLTPTQSVAKPTQGRCNNNNYNNNNKLNNNNNSKGSPITCCYKNVQKTLKTSRNLMASNHRPVNWQLAEGNWQLAT